MLVLFAAHVAEVGIEAVLLSIGEVSVFTQAIGPGRQERNAAELRMRLQLGQCWIRHPENVLAVDLELVSHVADGRHDGHLGMMRGVGEPHHSQAIGDIFAGGIVGGDGHKRDEKDGRKAHHLLRSSSGSRRSSRVSFWQHQQGPGV